MKLDQYIKMVLKWLYIVHTVLNAEYVISKMMVLKRIKLIFYLKIRKTEFLKNFNISLIFISPLNTQLMYSYNCKI